MIQATNLLVTAVDATGNALIDKQAGGAFQATIVGTGLVSCTVTIECSLDVQNWLTLGTIELSGTTTDTDGFSSIGQWVAYRAVVSLASGTISSISVNMSTED